MEEIVLLEKHNQVCSECSVLSEEAPPVLKSHLVPQDVNCTLWSICSLCAYYTSSGIFHCQTQIPWILTWILGFPVMATGDVLPQGNAKLGPQRWELSEFKAALF